MPTLADEALCIRHWEWSETSQTVSLFARSAGLIRGLAKGSRRPRSAFGGGFDLLSRGQILAVGKADATLLTLTEWTLLESFPRLRSDLAANRAGFYVADLIARLLPPFDPHPHLYDEAAAALRRLDAAVATDAVLLRFQWALLDAAGYRPRLDPEGAVAEEGDAVPFSAALGGVVPGGERTEGVRRWRVRRGTIDALRRVAAIVDSADEPEDSADGPADRPDEPDPALPDDSVGRASRLLAAYLREILGDEPLTMRQCFPQLPIR
jgi:DNA repair protein RecO (recombination protein O)